MKIYLDVCCLNRPFDDQQQRRIRLESEAVLLIIDKIKVEKDILLSSDAIEVEIENTPDTYKQKLVREMIKSVSSEYIKYSPKIIERAKELLNFGFKKMDSLHIACAEAANVDVFLSTDDKLLKLAERNSLELLVSVDNPLIWLKKKE